MRIPDTRFEDWTSSIYDRKFTPNETDGTNPYADYHDVELLVGIDKTDETTVEYAVRIDDTIGTHENGTVAGIPVREAFLFMRLEFETPPSDLRQHLQEGSQNYLQIGRASLSSAGDLAIAHISEPRLDTRSSEA